LIDGGVLNPVPIAPTFNDDTDITIAVNLGGPISSFAIKTNQTLPKADVKPSIQSSIKTFITSFQAAEKNVTQENWGMYDVANKAFDAMQSTIGRQKIAAYPPDIEIVIARNACGTLEFERSAEMIALGYKKAESFLKNST